MAERVYSKRELDEKFKNLEEKNDAWNATIVKQNEQILVEVKSTNGRVRRLEGWRLYLAGGLTIIVIIVLPALGYLAEQVIQSGEAISSLEGQVSIIIKNLNRSPLP